MKKFLTLLSASGMAAVIGAGAAMAQTYPANVLGTWTILANNTQPFTFTVQGQSSDRPCALITGTFSLDNLVGYYCPATGTVSFERNSSNTGATFQVYTGQLSWTGTQTQMTGNFSNYDHTGNNTGAYSFSAQYPGN